MRAPREPEQKKPKEDKDVKIKEEMLRNKKNFPKREPKYTVKQLKINNQKKPKTNKKELKNNNKMMKTKCID